MKTPDTVDFHLLSIVQITQHTTLKITTHAPFISDMHH